MNIKDNTISYLKEYGHLTFQEKEFNLVDSLILCQLSYFKLDTIVGGLEEGKRPVFIKSLRRHPQYEHLYGDTRFEEQYRAFYVALYNSPRFRDISMNYFMDILDDDMEMQFSAVTFFMGDWIYIAYRGTDESIVGWKEDFNMAFMSPIPTQVAALRYLEKAGDLWKGKIVLGGHSKGGNVAMYAGMECREEIQNRIFKIDCFDGPGFRDDVYKEEGYLAVADRIQKIVPEKSFVGMMFQNQIDYKVVKSTGTGVLQHDPFTWVIKNGDFEYVEEIYKTSLYKDEAFNKWICDIPSDQREVFVNSLFEIIKGAEAATLIELTEEWYKSTLAMLSTFKHLDKDTKRSIRKIILLLFKNGRISKK